MSWDVSFSCAVIVIKYCECKLLYEAQKSSLKFGYLTLLAEFTQKRSNDNEYILKLKIVGHGSPFSFNLRIDVIITTVFLLIELVGLVTSI